MINKFKLFIIKYLIKWFAESKGKASAIVLLGFGVGNIVYPEFATFFINGKNISPDEPFSIENPNEKSIQFIQKSIYISI